ncbi:MAG: hypothetical protein C4518_09750 [Desulfobacteraceae bacterium]|nr:MAG: hypothetical protein C4518_09750 [Desulfobacteraceae bacterium]
MLALLLLLVAFISACRRRKYTSIQ